LYGPLILWLMVGALFVASRWLGQAGMLAQFALLPGARSLAMPLIAGNTCMVLRAGVTAGMLHHQSLDLAADGCGNRVYSERIHRAAAKLRGEQLPDLTSALNELQFPETVVQLCANGEVAGKLEETLGRCATMLRDSFKERTTWAVRALSGLLYGLIMLAIVAYVISFYMGYAAQVAEVSDAFS
jgi:type II secretory pathway component PulF